MLQKIQETASYLKNKFDSLPHIGIILGTGLGNLVTQLTQTVEIPYDTIPNFPVSTVEGHQGKLILGQLGNVDVLVMQGRFHYYEGYDMQEVTFPVRVMQAIGIDTLLISNASGGINPDFEIGDLMFITDHINLFPEHPLRGKNYEALGTRFPDMSEAYSKALITQAKAIAAKHKIKVVEGVYAGTGPTFDTCRIQVFSCRWCKHRGYEYRSEVIVAKHAGMQVFGISVITDLGVPSKIVEISHEEYRR